MNAVSPICLVDLAPALRWSKSPDVAPLLHHDRLIEGWWNSLPIARVLEIAGPPWLAHSLARLAVEQWGHVPLVEFLPSLRGQQVECGELAEPVRTVVASTAGHWDRLVNASPQEIDSWSLHECRTIDVISTVAWRALRPCGNLPTGPVPSPALMLEAVRTITHWLPESAPEHVRDALDYLNGATNAGDLPSAQGSEDSDGPPQTPATRAIRTLRALRAQRDREEQGRTEHQSTTDLHEPPASEQTPVGGMISSAAMIPENAHETAPAEPATAPATEEPGGTDLRSRFRSSLLGPGRTLRRPSFGPPKAMRADTEETPDSPALGEHPLVDQVEQMIRSWPELERTVAAERLFATDPISIRVLSEQISVDVNDIRAAQRKVEESLLTWLNSTEGASLTKHLRDLSEQLGTATTIDRLINAHADHPVDVPTLQTPMWRVIITLFTDRRMHNGWLIADDPNRLRWQTREMVTDAPNLTDAGNRLARIGIRQPELRAWLLSTPGINIRDGHVFVDPSVPMETPANAPAPAPQGMDGAMTENGLPIRRRPDESATAPPQEQYAPQHGSGAAPQPVPAPPTPPPATPAAAHCAPGDPSMAARCFRAPDGRWWHRVDITADHLNGAPVAVPTGYATHLGLQPGRLLCLTAPGADLLVLVWRDQPAFDSLRPLLRRQAAQPGDRMFITVSGDRLDARKLPATDMSGFSPAARALHLSGYTAPASAEEALRILSRRITDSDESAPTDPQALLEHLSRRGDEDIAQELHSGLFATH